MKILYLGYNSFGQHKRGVENVIDFQSKACDFKQIYYIHWGTKTTAYKNNKFLCISIKNDWYWPIILNYLLFRIRLRNKIIIHSHNPLFSFFSIYKTNILTVHDGLYYLNKSKNRNLVFMFRLIESILYFRCSLVHFISVYTKKQTLFGKRSNFIIIPNTSHLEPLVPKLEFYNEKSPKRSILVVRSIEERARFDILLQVAEELRGKDYVITVAGKGPLLAFYQNEILKRNLDNIELLGYVNDGNLRQLYLNCDIVLMIAEYGEGFGLPIIEGYLFNKPVIASNRCAIPEVIISINYLFENTVNDILQKIDFVMNISYINYRDYYDLKYSNSIVLTQMRKHYVDCYL